MLALLRISRDADSEVSRIESAAAFVTEFCTLNADIKARIPARPATTPVITTSTLPAFFAKWVDATSRENTPTRVLIAAVAPRSRCGSRRLNAATAATMADIAMVMVINVP